MRHLALAAVGRDRPGIVAAVTEALLRHGVNVEDSRMAILRGHFSMMLILAAPEDADAAALERDLEAVRGRLGLETLSLGEVAETDSDAVGSEPTHVVTVYGGDHPGIVHAVAAALAEQAVNIADLSTRLVEEQGAEPLYVMMLEVVLPPASAPGEIEAALAEVATRERVEVSVRPLEPDEL